MLQVSCLLLTCHEMGFTVGDLSDVGLNHAQCLQAIFAPVKSFLHTDRHIFYSVLPLLLQVVLVSHCR